MSTSGERDPERRSDPRHRRVRAAVISYDGLPSPIPCVLLDISKSGARLNVAAVVDLPDTFVLDVESENLHATCQIVWRKGDEVGVKILD